MRTSFHSCVNTLKDTWDLGARGIWEKVDLQTVLRAAGETKTTQENIQDWLQLEEGASDRRRNCCSDICFIYFSSALPISLNCPFICFLSFFFVL
jgi:hypothetical protein